MNFKAGKGGDGCFSLERGPNLPKMGPGGGDGGAGGSIILKADHNTKDLRHVLPSYKSEKGIHGMGSGCFGRNGKDFILRVPVGTKVRDAVTKEELCDLVHDEDEHVIARGGHAGVGNIAFSNSVYRAPRESLPGGPGEEKFCELEMQIIADVGLVSRS